MRTILAIAGAYVVLLSILSIAAYRRARRRRDLDALGTVDSHREAYRD